MGQSKTGCPRCRGCFSGALSASGNCLSLAGLGGSGTEQIRELVVTADRILVLGSFNGSMDLGEEKPFLSRGGMDSFVSFYDHDLKSLSPGIRFGDEGDGVLLGGASVFGDNYLLAGLSKGKLGQNLGYDLSGNGESLVTFLSVYGSAEFSAKVWPEPRLSAGGKLFRVLVQYGALALPMRIWILP